MHHGQAFQLVVRCKEDPSKLLCLDMRPANTAKVWDDAVDVLVSSQGPVDDSSPNVHGLYFAVLLNRELVPDIGALQQQGSGATSLRAGSLSSEGSLEEGSSVALWQATPMPDVHIGPLLGHGAYGRVYLGKMGAEGEPSTIVAVKVWAVLHVLSVMGDAWHVSSDACREFAMPVYPQVIPHRHIGTTKPLPLRGASGAEGAMGLRLQHPHVIRTHKFVTLTHEAPTVDANPAKRARAGERIVRRHFPGLGDGLHSWIVLEYCDHGTLQSAIDKGALRTEHSTWKGGPNMRAVLTVAHDVASAMAYLHEQVCCGAG